MYSIKLCLQISDLTYRIHIYCLYELTTADVNLNDYFHVSNKKIATYFENKP